MRNAKDWMYSVRMREPDTVGHRTDPFRYFEGSVVSSHELGARSF